MPDEGDEARSSDRTASASNASLRTWRRSTSTTSLGPAALRRTTSRFTEAALGASARVCVWWAGGLTGVVRLRCKAASSRWRSRPSSRSWRGLRRQSSKRRCVEKHQRRKQATAGPRRRLCDGQGRLLTDIVSTGAELCGHCAPVFADMGQLPRPRRLARRSVAPRPADYVGHVDGCGSAHGGRRRQLSEHGRGRHAVHPKGGGA